MKYFRMSYEEVVFKRSYINLILLNRAIPGIKPFNEKDDDTFNNEYEPSKVSKQSKHANDFFMNFM